MDRFLFLTVNGLSRGAVFAAFALALVLIWRGARLVNFAQGAMAVATAYLAFSVTLLRRWSTRLIRFVRIPRRHAATSTLRSS